MAEESEASRMRALLNKFEEKKEEPPPPPKERVQSALDAPRPELSAQAKTARVQSLSRVKSETGTAAKGRRFVPQIAPTDTDEERDLKRKIQATEQEILDVASKLAQIAERLDRAVETFHASVVGTAASVPEALPSTTRARAFDAAAEGAGQDSGETNNSRQSAPTASGTSLEAILAAARSGKPRVKSETPKYSKLLRDLK